MLNSTGQQGPLFPRKTMVDLQKSNSVAPPMEMHRFRLYRINEPPLYRKRGPLSEKLVESHVG